MNVKEYLMMNKGFNPHATKEEMQLPMEKPMETEEMLTPCQEWLKSLDHVPTDEEVHAWAEQNGIEKNKVEMKMYELAKAYVDSQGETTQEYVGPLSEEEVKGSHSDEEIRQFVKDVVSGKIDIEE